MTFNEATVHALQNLEGANHSFLKQICTPQGKSLRSQLNQLLQDIPDSVSQRWKEHFQSLTNERFFQGFAELLSYSALSKQGWEAIEWTWPCPTLRVKHKNGQEAQLLTLSFIQQRDRSKEQRLRNKLISLINQIQTDQKISLIFRKPLHQDSYLNDIRDCIADWLADNPKEYEHAYFKNDQTWIELTALPKENFCKAEVVQIVQGPLFSSELIHYINKETESSLEEYRLSHTRIKPLLLSIISNQPFPISDNSWRFFLYGPTAEVFRNKKTLTYRCDADQMKGWLQDPFRTFLAGILRIESLLPQESSSQSVDLWPNIRSASFINPWSEFSNFNELLPGPKLSLDRLDKLDPILQWKE
jgi:hypothetical protein